MATLDLQEQEQLDNLKAFWARWGNLITTLLTLALLAFAGFNGWNWWQREQGLKASVLYDEVERAAQAKDLDKAQRMWLQMKEQSARMTYTAQAALLLADAQQAGGKAEAALAPLQWAAEHGNPPALRDLAQLRLASLHLDAKRYKEAEAALAKVESPAFAALVADRRGDLAQVQGQLDPAREQYKTAYLAMAAEQPYRQLIAAKLTALAVDVDSLKAKDSK
ncbi:putative negative regulator of RcsB-dependent stress response [Inhella inkyongensis]|uniref:Ancillary SecYEG translocon subunit n=1 Tax=Inhella inkyongensis TaxID=392593 RepID=A0A840RYD6_9BURK|nr:tetratricopeptide repeat protein [Inhella inkyongensis]MBB5203737.1 putative negative regulator of RcsB-dependent stress response [Inhella inkyongensis]